MEKTLERPCMAAELEKFKSIQIKRNRFLDSARLANKMAERIIDEITPALKKCDDTNDVIIMISAYKKRIKRLQRKALVNWYLSKIFK